MKKGSAVALPSGTRYGAHVAPQRCTILRNGKAVISYHIRGVFYPLKFKIVLDMGYTSLFVFGDSLLFLGIFLGKCDDKERKVFNA